ATRIRDPQAGATRSCEVRAFDFEPRSGSKAGGSAEIAGRVDGCNRRFAGGTKYRMQHEGGGVDVILRTRDSIIVGRVACDVKIDVSNGGSGRSPGERAGFARGLAVLDELDGSGGRAGGAAR